eukprot:6004057-Pleurochrysis_carterae.AAC.1
MGLAGLAVRCKRLAADDLFTLFFQLLVDCLSRPSPQILSNLPPKLDAPTQAKYPSSTLVCVYVSASLPIPPHCPPPPDL